MLHQPRPSIRRNYAELKAAQKSSRGAPLYSVLVNRRLGRVLAAIAHSRGLTPNQVTVISAVFTFTGLALLAVRPPTLSSGLAVTGLLVIGYAMDAADGQLARLQGGGTLTGEWLDHIVDALKIASLHLVVLIMMYRHFDTSDLWLLVPIIFAAVDVLHFFGMLLTDLLTRNAHLRSSVTPTRTGGSSFVNSALKLPTDYGFQCFVFVLLAVPIAFQWTYLSLMLANVVYTALVLGVWFRRLKTLDAASRDGVSAQR